MTLNELEARQAGRAEVFSTKDALNIGKPTQTNLNELQKAVRSNGESLHIIQQLNAEHTPFVVCWHFDGKTWDWGTYCQTLEQAQTVFRQKCAEHGFVEKSVTPVVRIDYLGSDGEVGESIAYTDAKKFLADLKRENYHGVPMSITLYCDESGRTIPQDFIENLDPPAPVNIAKYAKSQQARQDGRADVFYALKENGASDFSMLNTAKTMKLSKQEYSEIKANVNARYLAEHPPAPPDKPSGLTLE